MSELVHQPSFAVLLCIYHANKYIREQIDSILLQDQENIAVWVSDDGEDDGSCDLIRDSFKSAPSRKLHIRKGRGEGFVTNFLDQICNEEIDADYYAFSDQDDIWKPNKLSRALDFLKTIPQSTPALYCSRTELIDGVGKSLGLSLYFPKKPNFSNAIVQSIAGGNTMVMNRAARDILRKVSAEQAVVSHDWWTYIIISAVGGKIFYDLNPTVEYRQHSNNIVGSNTGFSARLSRIHLLLNGRFSEWNEAHIQSLMVLREMMSPENREIFDNFRFARKRWVLPRLYGIWKSGVYRQTLWGNIGLFIATLLKRI